VQEKCIVVSDRTVCSRLANEGKFLLDTVFQSAIPNLNTNNNSNGFMSGLTPVSYPPYPIYNTNNYHVNTNRTLELTLNDASILLNALRSLETSQSVANESLTVQTLVDQLDSQIKFYTNGSASSCSNGFSSVDVVMEYNEPSGGDDDGALVNSWTTIRLTECYHYMTQTFQQCIDELKRTNLQSPAISILSLLLDRLYRLDATLIESHLLNAQLTNSSNHNVGSNNNAAFTSNYDKRYMCSEVIFLNNLKLTFLLRRQG
jgi:hypothetical protein